MIGRLKVLNDLEAQIADLVGQARHDLATEKNFKNMKRSRKTDLEISIDGADGEIVFASLFNRMLDLETMSKADEGDFVIDGLRIDVKTVEPGRNLLVHAHKRGRSDVFALVVGVRPVYIFMGFISAEAVFGRQISDVGRGPTYFVSPVELEEWEEIVRNTRTIGSPPD